LTPSQQPSPPKPTLPAVFSTAAIIAVCLFSHLGSFGLVGPDEPRYAWIARAMAQTGDWVTPRLYGSPWFEKPILYYWAAAVGFAMHLPAEWAARLPSAFAALAAALAIAWLGCKFYEPSRPDEGLAAATGLAHPVLLAPIIFATSVAAIGFARAATPDMLFSASIALAMAAAANLLRNLGVLRSTEIPSPQPSASALSLILFGAFLGLGVLAKGPAAVILAGGALVIWALTTKNFRPTLRLAHPLAIAAFCVVALPWYVICARRNPDFLHVFVFQHNFERYLTPVFQHVQPFWFFLPITLLAALPWAAFSFLALHQSREALHQKLWQNSPTFFFSCWALFPVLFFSASHSKLPSYILPAIPPLALVLAAAARNGFKQQRGLSILVGTLMGITWLALGIAAGQYFLPNPQTATAAQSILLVACVAALISFVAGFKLNLRLLILASAAAAAITVEIAGPTLLPGIDPDISARQRAAWIDAAARPDLYTFHLTRSMNFGLAFYAARPIAEWAPENSGAASILTTSQGLIELKKLGRFSGGVNPQERGIRYVKIEPVAR
jgi:4-amino-4-deoxy-L-arabinose transferase-like glycosyltransferase